MRSYRKAEVITPVSFFKVSFGCSSNDFYNIKNLVQNVCYDLDPENEELWDLFVEETCDFEGDLDTIRICRDPGSEDLIKTILERLEIKESISEGMDLVLSIF